MQKIKMQIMNHVAGLMRLFFHDIDPQNEITHKIKHTLHDLEDKNEKRFC